jgi:hypothetical protein
MGLNPLSSIMALTKTLLLSLLAVLSVNTIAIAPIHAVGVGTTWNHYPPTSNAQWNAITFGNGLFVAVSSSLGLTPSSIMTSPDGITWTERTPPVTAEWSGIAFGNNTFVAVASDGNNVMTSVDGISWSAHAHNLNTSWQAISFGNNIFVAVGTGNSADRIMTSSNGIIWTGQNDVIGSGAYWSSITYGDLGFVAVGEMFFVGTSIVIKGSMDGTSWSAATSPLPTNTRTVAFGDGVFVATTTVGGAMRSTDQGATWSAVSTPTTNFFLGLTYGAGTFVAVAASGTNRVMTSSDGGITWQSQNSGTAGDWNAVTYGNGRFVAVANTGSSQVMVSVVPVIDSGPPPPPWLQSYALSGGETSCMDGWSQSWAQWPNNNSGGFVCNRSTYWSSGAQAWLEKPGF